MSATYEIPTVAVPPKETLQIATVARTTTLSERKAILAPLISSLHSPPRTDRAAVQLTLAVISVALDAAGPLYTTAGSLTVQMVELTFARWMEVLGLTGTAQPDQKLIPLPASPPQESALVVGTSAIMSAVALIIFAMGRQARESAPDAATIKRPDALVRKYSLTDQEQRILPGRDMGPSVACLEKIFSAFGTYTELKAITTRLLLGYRKAMVHYPPQLDPIMTQFKLMRWSGLTHVGAVVKLMQAHPWVARVPQLEPYFRYFAKELGKFNSIPAEVREYHRLLAPPDEFLFVSSDFKPLIAVAGSFVEEVEATFAGYVYNKDQYADLIEEVRSRRPGYNPVHALAALADDLGLSEIPPLPPRHSKPPTIVAGPTAGPTF